MPSLTNFFRERGEWEKGERGVYINSKIVGLLKTREYDVAMK
jgi:hypothetical protein